MLSSATVVFRPSRSNLIWWREEEGREIDENKRGSAGDDEEKKKEKDGEESPPTTLASGRHLRNRVGSIFFTKSQKTKKQTKKSLTSKCVGPQGSIGEHYFGAG